MVHRRSQGTNACVGEIMDKALMATASVHNCSMSVLCMCCAYVLFRMSESALGFVAIGVSRDYWMAATDVFFTAYPPVQRIRNTPSTDDGV